MTAPDPDRAGLLCTLSRDGEGAPLYLVPSLGTTPLSLVRLARAVSPRRRVHAFGYAGMDDERPPHRSLEAMASAYVDELLALSPRGPFLFAGHCLGGTVALEMALQLEARGVPVARVVVLDSIAPLLAEASPGESAGMADAADTALEADVRRVVERVVARTVSHYATLPPEVARHLGDLLRLHGEAGSAYRARALQARVHILFTEDCPRSVLAGWARIAAGGVTLNEVPGDTFSMLRPPHVEAVGRTLGAALLDAERGAAALT